MAFDSVTFWLFFPLAWAVWRGLPFGLARRLVAGLSLGFYAWWNPAYLVLIVGSALVDYQVGRALVPERSDGRRRALVALSLACNLGLLGVFKYTPFAAETYAALLGRPHDPSRFELWVVPVGISFYTFQTLSYTIDLYRRQVAPARTFADFLLYVSFFPQLVAGPIVRARSFLPQLEQRAPLTALRVRHGLYRCIEGLFLKVVVADGVAPGVIRAFDQAPAALSPVGAWFASILFGAQIFADFAGYSGIAIGLACLLGLRFPENFRAPYIARSLSEFWTRWHITLSTWLRDYLYIPLGGNRRGRFRTYVHLMVVMLLGGLWHGASWNFVVWGGLHGLGLCVMRLVPLRGLRGAVRERALGLASGVLVYAFVHVTWVYFRAVDLNTATVIARAMLVEPFEALLGIGDASLTAGAAPSWRYGVLLVPVALIHGAQWLHERHRLPRSELLRGVAAGAMLFGILVTDRREAFEFIYFQF